MREVYHQKPESPITLRITVEVANLVFEFDGTELTRQ